MKVLLALCRFKYVRADKVLRLRELLDKLGTIPGMMGEEKGKSSTLGYFVSLCVCVCVCVCAREFKVIFLLYICMILGYLHLFLFLLN